MNLAVNIEPSAKPESIQSPPANWRRYVNSLIASEISLLTRYCSKLLQLSPRSSDTGLLLESIDCKEKKVIQSVEQLTEKIKPLADHTAILLNGNFNH